MDIKKEKLERIFNPRNIAIIGAKPKEETVGWGLMKNALQGKTKRKIFAVNPNHKKVLGVPCVPSINSIKEEVDLAVVAVPVKAVLQVVEECCQKKVGGIILISSGFSESGPAGKKLENELINITKKVGIPLIGPNCLGIIRPEILLNATFAPAMPKSGEIAFISQSGALLDSVVDENLNKNYGFSFLASYGNEADVSLSDFLEFAAKDDKTKVIALYLEGIKEGRKIIDVFSEISKKKPIIVLKAGRTKTGSQAAASHTGSLAGEHQVYQALFKQTRVVEVDTLRELFALAKTLAWQPKCKNGVAIITNGGSCGVLLADYCQELGIKLTELNEATLKKLNKPAVMHPAYSARNPLDIIGDALSEKYESAVNILLEQPDINGLIMVQTLQIMTKTEKNAKIIVTAKKKWEHKPIITAFLGGPLTEPGIKILESNKIPNYSDLKEAALAIKSLIKNDD